MPWLTPKHIPAATTAIANHRFIFIIITFRSAEVFRSQMYRAAHQRLCVLRYSEATFVPITKLPDFSQKRYGLRRICSGRQVPTRITCAGIEEKSAPTVSLQVARDRVSSESSKGV